MGEVHELIIRDGRDATLAQATGKVEKSVVEIASTILGEDSTRLGITYAGFCFTALPHRKLPDEQGWVRESKNIKLVVDPGLYDRNGETVRIGVPYGSRARLILIYLQSEAIKTQSQEVSLGRSMQEWLTKMGIPKGGKTYKDIKDQAERISACYLSFFWKDISGAKGFKKSGFVSDGISLRTSDPAQGELWTDTVKLSDDFYRALKEHPVPIWEPAIREIGNRSMALDIYIWLAYRLHALAGPTPVSWSAIMDQFGAGFAAMNTFRLSFKEALSFALAVYPEAKVGIAPDGLTLYPSRPPIDKAKTFAIRTPAAWPDPARRPADGKVHRLA